MRALVVEALDEGLEAGLLLQEVRGGGFRGLGLEREVHALVTPILLGMARFDPFEPDAQA